MDNNTLIEIIELLTKRWQNNRELMADCNGDLSLLEAREAVCKEDTEIIELLIDLQENRG